MVPSHRGVRQAKDPVHSMLLELIRHHEEVSHAHSVGSDVIRLSLVEALE